MSVKHAATFGSEWPAAPDPLPPSLNAGLGSWTGQRPARAAPIRPQGRAQGIGAVTFGQVAPLKRLAMRLLPSL
jgi:hypothetical protein